MDNLPQASSPRSGLIVIILLVVALGTGIVLVKGMEKKPDQVPGGTWQGQVTTPRATVAVTSVISTHSATTVTLQLVPKHYTFKVNQTKTFDLQAVVRNTKPGQRLDYFKGQISFYPAYLGIPTGHYIKTSASGFGKVLRVDGPLQANSTGMITIELAAKGKNAGPILATDRILTLASIDFVAKTQTPAQQEVKLDQIQLIDNTSQTLPVEGATLSYTIEKK